MLRSADGTLVTDFPHLSTYDHILSALRCDADLLMLAITRAIEAMLPNSVTGLREFRTEDIARVVASFDPNPMHPLFDMAERNIGSNASGSALEFFASHHFAVCLWAVLFRSSTSWAALENTEGEDWKDFGPLNRRYRELSIA